jgi:tetratricopeptide (TPR) repeat protein
MALRYFGWEGTQFDISDIVKPKRPDRNVNPEELAYYVNNYAGWLRAIYRVNGDAARLKALISAGFPVIIEETFRFEEPYWLHDDLWAAHYLLLTGYDDAAREFTSQDSFHGENQILPYDELEENWEPFNHLYFIVYLPEEEDEIKGILGEDWEEDSNRKRALAASQKRIQENPDDAFAWFNLGSYLLYFERYDEAADAYDTARNLGLPQRMMRYQFGPFIAYFQSNRIDDLLTLTNYALKITPTSEEALLWYGWAKYREGDYAAARKDWEEALARHPGYADAEYALRFLSGNSP